MCGYLPGSSGSKLSTKEGLPVPKRTHARENSFPEGLYIGVIPPACAGGR